MDEEVEMKQWSRAPWDLAVVADAAFLACRTEGRKEAQGQAPRPLPDIAHRVEWTKPDKGAADLNVPVVVK